MSKASEWAKTVKKLGNGEDRQDRPTLVNAHTPVDWIARVSGAAGWMEVNFSQLSPFNAHCLASWILDTFGDAP